VHEETVENESKKDQWDLYWIINNK
jgi:hypothetical protein